MKGKDYFSSVRVFHFDVAASTMRLGKAKPLKRS
jgi:hypothetical protein